jgi:hypothetical protein
MQSWRLAKGFALWPLLVTPVFLQVAPSVARADCTTDLAALKAKLPAVKDTKRREEAKLLLEKAAIEQQHARAALCEAAVESAGKLVN